MNCDLIGELKESGIKECIKLGETLSNWEEEINNIQTVFGEFDYRSNKNIYKVTLGKGYLNINDSWDFNYRIEREYHLGKKGTDSKSYVWDNEISFVRLNKGFKIGEQSVSSRSVLGIKHNETDTKLLKSSSTLGYGFQWSNTFENEYMDYNNYKGAIRSKVESLFRWTYELGRN